MDTSTVLARADTLGRRVVPRQHRSLAEKLRIVAEARVPGASVAAVARAHGVNANLVFAWMRQQEQGLLSDKTRRRSPALLAVSVEPSAAKAMPTAEKAERTAERIEIELPDGTVVRAYGAVRWDGVERVLRLLRR